MGSTTHPQRSTMQRVAGIFALFVAAVMGEEMMLESAVSAHAMAKMMTEEFAYTSEKSTLAKLQCPMGKVGCPLCYEIVERWNAKGHLPNQFDAFCNDVEKTWKAHYQTLTGKLYDELKEKTRCVAVSAGVKEMVHQGCSLPTCNPEMACAAFC